MDLGQMIAVMQQMPGNVTVGKGGDGGVSSDSAGAGFAGLLKEIRAQIKVADVSSEQLAAQSTPVEQMGSNVSGGALSALIGTLAGNVVQPPVKDSTGTTSADCAKLEVTKNEDSDSQNVMTNQQVVELNLLMAQLHGRMPDGTKQTEGQAESVLSQNQSVSGSGGAENTRLEIMPVITTEDFKAAGNGLKLISGSEKLDKAVTSGIQSAGERSDADTGKNANVSSPSAKNQNGVLAPISTQEVPVGEQVTAGNHDQQQAQFVAVAIPVSTPQNEVNVTEGDNNSTEIQKGAVRPVESVFSGTDQKIVKELKNASTEVSGQVDMLLQQYTSRTVKPVVGTVDPTAKVAQQTGVKASFPVGTENRVLQLDQPQTPIPTAEETARTVVRPVQMQMLNTETPAHKEQLPEVPVQQETGRMVRSAVPTVQPVAEVVSHTPETASESGTVRIEPDNSMKMKQIDPQETVKSGVVAISQEKNPGTAGQENTDQGMGGNFQSHMMGHQVKAESVPTASTVSAVTPGDVSRPDQTSEQVVQQVRDRFAAHDTKPGSDQIVLRLSPEHLGELKVNLNLEGQRLKVEIVAENRMVRDSLMQHTDSLKESLSRQNIKMESFDVTTGGNSHTDGGRNQNDWRELVQQRQQKSWLPEGGYRLPKEVAPAVAAYQAKSQHSMVDLHY